MSAMRPGPQPEKWNESVYTNGKQMLSCDGGASLKYADQVPRRSQWTLLHYETLKRWMNLWEIGALQAWPKVLIDELAQNFSKSEIGATLGDGLYCQLQGLSASSLTNGRMFRLQADCLMQFTVMSLPMEGPPCGTDFGLRRL